MQAKLQLVPIGQLGKFAGKKVRGAAAGMHCLLPCPRFCPLLHCAWQSSFQEDQPAGLDRWQEAAYAHRTQATSNTWKGLQRPPHAASPAVVPAPLHQTGWPCLVHYMCCSV